MYQISGCTFDFADSRTRRVWSDMNLKDKQAFPLFAVEKYGTADRKGVPDLSNRHAAFKELAGKYLKRKQWPDWVLPVIYNPYLR